MISGGSLSFRSRQRVFFAAFRVQKYGEVLADRFKFFFFKLGRGSADNTPVPFHDGESEQFVTNRPTNEVHFHDADSIPGETLHKYRRTPCCRRSDRDRRIEYGVAQHVARQGVAPLMMGLRHGMPRSVGAVLLLLLLLLGEGCYYVQAIRGHSDLMRRRRPVEEVIEDAESPEQLRRKLELLREAREFSVAELLLPDNDSYRSYADLDRPFVVWNVFAAPEFSLEPKTWCYPVAGCVAYRGYFDAEVAGKAGRKLRQKGYDVAIGGVAAYSTLGRFSDPLLNTMMHWSDTDLVATMFHELAHQQLYIKGDSGFNESFATAVAEFGIERWLVRRGEDERLDAYLERKALRKDMMLLLEPVRQKLAALYSSDLDADAKRQQKTAILASLSSNAAALIAANGADVSNWLAAPLNNANLVSLQLYEGYVDSFRVLLNRCRQDMACFYERAAALAELDDDERRRALEELI